MTTVHERYARRRRMRMLVRLGSIALVLGAYFGVFLWPRISVQAELDETFQQRKSELERFRLEAQALARADASRQERERHRRGLDHAIPQGRVEIEAKTAIEAAASRAGVQVTERKPLPERLVELPDAGGGDMEEMEEPSFASEQDDAAGEEPQTTVCMARPFEIRGTGEFPQILAFVDALENAPLFLRLTAVEMERTEAAPLPALEFRVAVDAFAMRAMGGSGSP